jgi:hypothetical protein
MTDENTIAYVTHVTAEILAANQQLTETLLKRPDGFDVNTKLLTLESALFQHIKTLHIVLQARLPEGQKSLWSQVLRRKADAEEQEENQNVKGGESVSG